MTGADEWESIFDLPQPATEEPRVADPYDGLTIPAPTDADVPPLPGESGYAAAVFASNDPIMGACNLARSTDAQIREIMDDFQDTVVNKIVGLVGQDEGARPISDDLPALVRSLTAVTSMTLARDSAFVGRGVDPARATEIAERLWLYGLWGGADLRGE